MSNSNSIAFIILHIYAQYKVLDYGQKCKLIQMFFALYTVVINAFNNCSFNKGHGPCGQICNQLPTTVYCTCEAGFILLEDHLHCLGNITLVTTLPHLYLYMKCTNFV